MRAFREQVKASARAAQAYHKVVTDRNQTPAQVEDTLYQPPWQVRAAGDSLFLPLEDLSYALDRYYDDPFLADRYTRSQAGDTLIARLRPELDNKSELKLQKIIRQGPEGPFRYIETHIVRDSWLYRTEVRIAVFFDAQARYERHRLDVSAGVPLLGHTFEAGTTGKLLYP